MKKFHVAKTLQFDTLDNISWAAGFGTLTLTMGVSLAIFLSGINKYRKQGSLGSPFTMVVQVLVAASRKWHADEKHGVLGVCFGDEITNIHLEAQPTLTKALAHTNQFRYVPSLKSIHYFISELILTSLLPRLLGSYGHTRQPSLILFIFINKLYAYI